MSHATIGARIAEASEAEDRRHAPRTPVEIGARVRPLGEEGSDARILNLSETGFMAETSAVFRVGARVWLMVPGRERANAIVKWTAGTRLGGQFAEPLRLDGPLV